MADLRQKIEWLLDQGLCSREVVDCLEVELARRSGNHQVLSRLRAEGVIKKSGKNWVIAGPPSKRGYDPKLEQLPWNDVRFREEWETWCDIQADEKRALKRTRARLHLRTLLGMGLERAIKALEHSSNSLYRAPYEAPKWKGSKTQDSGGWETH